MALKTFDLGYIGGASTETVGSETKPVYQNAGEITAVTSLDATLLSGVASINTTGNASTATHATSATNADEATHATSADSATKATQDSEGNVITDTYLTADSALDATKLTGIASVDTTGNAATATSATTAAACTGNSATATKAEQDADGNTISATYATKAEDAAKLPLSGGTMTGGLAIQEASDNSPTLTFVSRTDNSVLNRIYGGAALLQAYSSPNAYEGAYLVLRNASATSADPGSFTLAASTSSSNFTPLKGTAEGVLTWSSDIVECAVDKGTGYIKLSDGTQICYGIKNFVGTAGATVTFPRAFTDTPSITGLLYWTNYAYTLKSLTATSFDVVASSNTGSVSFHYIAVGTGA